MLHCMTIEDSYMLISLRPSTYVMGSYVNLGSFGVSGATVSRSVNRYSLNIFFVSTFYSNFTSIVYNVGSCGIIEHSLSDRACVAWFDYRLL